MGTAYRFQTITITLKHCSYSGGDAREIAAVQSWAVCRGSLVCMGAASVVCRLFGMLGAILASVPSAQLPVLLCWGPGPRLEGWHAGQIGERKGGRLGWWCSGEEDGAQSFQVPVFVYIYYYLPSIYICGIFGQIWIVTSVCYHPLPLIPTDSFLCSGTEAASQKSGSFSW